MRRTDVLYYFAGWRVQSRLEMTSSLVRFFSNVRIEELVSGLVAGEQDQAPDEVGKKSADQDDDQDGQSCHNFAVPCCNVSVLIGSPAARP